MLNEAAIDDAIDNIPPLPDAVIAVMNHLKSDAANAVTLERLVSQDPLLTSRLLKVANSPFFGMSNKIISIRSAYMVLGMDCILNVVVSMGALSIYPKSEDEGSLPNLRYHAIATAIASRIFAKKAKADPDLAFTAGLLHKLGLLVLQCGFPDQYAELIHQCQEKKCVISEIEEGLLGTSHQDLGVLLAKKWGLPDEIRGVLEDHQNIVQSTQSIYASIVHLASIVCTGLGMGSRYGELLIELNSNALIRCGMTFSDLCSHFSEIEEQAELIIMD